MTASGITSGRRRASPPPANGCRRIASSGSKVRNSVQPKVYTIAAHRPFLATLAAGLLGMAGADPLLLPRVTVLLPTRRAVRSLREAFLRAAPVGKMVGTPLLLPRMRPIGDLASD